MLGKSMKEGFKFYCSDLLTRFSKLREIFFSDVQLEIHILMKYSRYFYSVCFFVEAIEKVMLINQI